MSYPLGKITRVEELRASNSRRNGLGAKPNVYRRSYEARESTDAYLAEMERKAAGIDEPESPRRLTFYKVLAIGVAVLAAVGIALKMWVG